MQIGGDFGVALEDFVRGNGNVNIQIAVGCAVRARFALACEADALSVVDAGGDVHFHGFAGFHAPCAVTFEAGFFDFFACAAAGGAGLLDLEDGLANVDCACAVAGGAGGGFGACFCARAVAHVAFFVGGDGDLAFYACGGFF